MFRVSEGLSALALQGLQHTFAGQQLLPGAALGLIRAVGAAQHNGFMRQPGFRGFGRYRPATDAGGDEPVSAAPKQGSTVVLASGGVESAALLSYWKHWDHGQELLPLFVDCGQKNREQEEAAAQAICRELGLPFAAVNASMVAHQLHTTGAGRRHHDPLPHRNLLLLSLAASFATDSGAANVAICLNRDDLGAYSSASLPFLRHAESLYSTLDPPLQLLMPLLSLRKRQVVRLGQQVGAPWHLTHSCQRGGGGEPCGACASCEARAAAFEAAGVEDPLPLHHLAEAGGA